MAVLIAETWCVICAASVPFLIWELLNAPGERECGLDGRCQGFRDDCEQGTGQGLQRQPKEGFTNGDERMGGDWVGVSSGGFAGLGDVLDFRTAHGGSCWTLVFQKNGERFEYRCRSELTGMMFRHWMDLAKDSTCPLNWSDVCLMLNTVRDSEVMLWQG